MRTKYNGLGSPVLHTKNHGNRSAGSIEEAFVLCCLFWCQSFGDVSPYGFNIIFNSVWVADIPPFGKELLTRLTLCSPCILTICNFSYFPFWF